MTRWYLGSQNDGLFIIDTPPRPSNDDAIHDRKDGPSLVIPLGDIPKSRAQAIVDAHNSELLASRLAKQGPAWQGIESAPQDGTPIWVCNRLYTENGFLPLAVRWKTYHPNAKGEACWRDMHGHKVGGLTHWRPLPPSPVGGEPTEGQSPTLPHDVVNLVIAGREMFDLGYAPDHAEANALDRALDAFSSRVPYENQPDDEAPSPVGGSES